MRPLFGEAGTTGGHPVSAHQDIPRAIATGGSLLKTLAPCRARIFANALWLAEPSDKNSSGPNA
jgi:hypothetical protein